MRRHLLTAIAALLTYVFITNVPLYAQTLNIVTEKEWQPYAYEENGQVKGFAIEIISKVFAIMKVDYSVSAYPWAKSENLALTGKADAIFCASHKPEREAVCYYPSEQLFDSTYVFFINKSNENILKYNTFDDLKGHSIGTTRAYSYTSDFIEFIKTNNNYSEANSDKLNIRKLANKAIEYFPGEIGNVTMILKQEGLTDKITYLPKPLIQKPYYIIFNKKNVDKELVDKFSQTLKDFKAAPEFKAVYENYFGK